jgi:AbrB family looped-hinge helix DNA binding protein
MPTATLTSKGQITIPKEVRQELSLNTGDVIDFQKEPDGSFRVRARKHHASALAGILQRKGQRRISLREMDVAIARGAAGRSSTDDRS